MENKDIKYINNKFLNASKILEYYLYNYIYKINKNYNKIIFLCIGTSKFKGDCLGPLVGYNLQKTLKNVNNIKIYGTLKNQVNGQNLQYYIKEIKLKHKNSLIIAIDSALGKKQNVGYLKIGKGFIKPGSAIKSNLPCVGDIFITGIVNLKSNLPKISIKNTSIYIVMNMVKNISKAVTNTTKRLIDTKIY